MARLSGLRRARLVDPIARGLAQTVELAINDLREAVGVESLANDHAILEGAAGEDESVDQERTLDAICGVAALAPERDDEASKRGLHCIDYVAMPALSMERENGEELKDLTEEDGARRGPPDDHRSAERKRFDRVALPLQLDQPRLNKRNLLEAAQQTAHDDKARLIRTFCSILRRLHQFELIPHGHPERVCRLAPTIRGSLPRIP